MDLMGYNLVVEYKKGKENYVVDALSRKEEVIAAIDGSLSLITFPNFQWTKEIK